MSHIQDPAPTPFFFHVSNSVERPFVLCTKPYNILMHSFSFVISFSLVSFFLHRFYCIKISTCPASLKNTYGLFVSKCVCVCVYWGWDEYCIFTSTCILFLPALSFSSCLQTNAHYKIPPPPPPPIFLLLGLVIVQELCESRGGRPGLSVLTSLQVSVDVKLYWTMSWFGKLVWPIKSRLTSSRCRCKVGKILRPTTTFTLEWHNDIDTDMALKRRGSFFRTLKNVEPDFDDVYLDRGASAAASNKWLFEIAWEVANKGK